MPKRDIYVAEGAGREPPGLTLNLHVDHTNNATRPRVAAGAEHSVHHALGLLPKASLNARVRVARLPDARTLICAISVEGPRQSLHVRLSHRWPSYLRQFAPAGGIGFAAV